MNMYPFSSKLPSHSASHITLNAFSCLKNNEHHHWNPESSILMTLFKKFWVPSLEAQWLGLLTSNAEGTVLILDWGTKFLHVKQPKDIFFLV